jgi:diaminopimelate epimerase
MRGRSFIKMHGLGNDFVLIDARREPFAPSRAVARRIADRREGVGCDQLIVLEEPQCPGADIFMRIFNADGGEVAACGNAARCVAWLIMRDSGKDSVVMETRAGPITAHFVGADWVTVDMGPARLEWQEIPLAEARDTLHLGIGAGPLQDPVAVSMGNPHAVFFVDKLDGIELERLGPELERHPLFPDRANIGVAQVLDSERLRLRVWERGAGLTRACGSGACAAAVAAARRGLTGRRVRVEVDGGPLDIEWREDGHVLMAGPVAIAFVGEVDPAALAARG